MLLDLENGVNFFFNYSDVISFGNDRIVFSVTDNNEASLARFQTQMGRNRGLASMELHILDDRDSTITVKCANLKIVETYESRSAVQLVFVLEWRTITTYFGGRALAYDTSPIIGR